MEEQNPNENRPSIPTWVWILGVFALILGLQLFLNGRFNGPDQVPIQEIVTRIESGQVKSVVQSGSRLEVTLKDDTVLAAYKDSQEGLTQTLEFYGLTAEKLNELNVELVVRDQSAWNNFITIALSIGPVLLLIWIFTTRWQVPGQRYRKDSPMEILQKKYAEGSITKEEYEERRAILDRDRTK